MPLVFVFIQKWASRVARDKKKADQLSTKVWVKRFGKPYKPRNWDRDMPYIIKKEFTTRNFLAVSEGFLTFLEKEA